MKMVWYCVHKMKNIGKKTSFLHTLKLCIEGFDVVEEITDKRCPHTKYSWCVGGL